MPKVQGREDVVRNRYLLDGVLGERDPYCVPDPIRQELPQGRSALYGTRQPRSRLGHPEVQGRIGALAELLVRLDHLGDVARLEGDLEVEETHLFGDLDLVEGAGDERLGFG